VQSFVIGQLIL